MIGVEHKTETLQQPKSFRKRHVERTKATTSPRPDVQLVDNVKKEGWMFIPEDQQVYTDHMSITRCYKEEV